MKPTSAALPWQGASLCLLAPRGVIHLGLIGVALSCQLVAAPAYGMSLLWSDRESLSVSPKLSIAVADEISSGHDEAWPGDTCCLSVARCDPDPLASDEYRDLPSISARITETDPAVVTAEHASADANHTAHVLGIEFIATEPLVDDTGAITPLRSSQPHTVVMLLILSVLCATAGLRYRMRLQRRRWRRLAARRRAQWR